MRITKYGHCCLLIEHNNQRILTDPGFLSSSQNEIFDIDIVLITHEHKDHLHTDSLLAILANNPNALVITNTSVGKILKDLGVNYRILEGEGELDIESLHLSAHDGKHAEIVGEYGQVQNTGYFIDKTLFYPGDAYTNPNKKVPVLALPIAGPWCKVSEVIKYANEIKPGFAFPVHDGVLNEAGIKITHGVIQAKLTEAGIDFISLKNGEGFEPEV